ncbi:hypothetical protein Godav_019873 [Gossypium davidsonii]|uniref:Uncharacterized protein n=1 Tax=Gossypium davidsonii TaxID=34287 RepID=A0A7J8R174_GOSDV|nr:hypothetical protein [Gossypium davidsonii]
MLIHSLLLSTGFRQPRTLAGGPGLWIVAFYGSYIRNCSNFYFSRLLLLLYQECLWRAACSPSTLWGGLSEDAILLWSMSLLPKENITWLLM